MSIYKIDPETQDHLTANLDEMEAADEWECGQCGHQNIEDDPVIEGDMLICDSCQKEYRCA